MTSTDFFSPDAMQWWHRQQDALLDAGIDGWKLDFGESYMEEDATLETFAGPVAHQDYSEAYYRDFLAYGRLRRGPDFVTMVRAYDVSYDRAGRFHARPEHAPVAWMGDNHRDWDGLADALDHTFRSAAAGYVVVGSDIGGYLDRDQDNLTRTIPFDVEVFLIAEQDRYSLTEVPVRVENRQGSSVRLVRDTVDLLRDLVRIGRILRGRPRSYPGQSEQQQYQ